jgi:hypothetical protein
VSLFLVPCRRSVSYDSHVHDLLVLESTKGSENSSNIRMSDQLENCVFGFIEYLIDFVIMCLVNFIYTWL